MDSNNSGKGAYAPVTIPMEEKDGVKVTTEPQGRQQGFWTRQKIFIAAVVALVVVIIIIIIAVTVSRNKAAAANTEKTAPTKMPPLPPMTSTDGASPTQGKTTTATIPTTSPPVPGSFSGTVTLNKGYEYYYDDQTAPEYTTLATNFTNAMTALYGSADTAISGLFSETSVSQMSQNTTYVDIQFKVVVSAVQQGARDFLVEQLDPLPSTSLNTYPIIWVSIGQEIPVGSGISR